MLNVEIDLHQSRRHLRPRSKKTSHRHFHHHQLVLRTR